MVRNGTDAGGYHIPCDLSGSAVLFFFMVLKRHGLNMS